MHGTINLSNKLDVLLCVKRANKYMSGNEDIISFKRSFFNLLITQVQLKLGEAKSTYSIDRSSANKRRDPSSNLIGHHRTTTASSNKCHALVRV